VQAATAAAEAHAAEDHRRRELVDARNEAESLAYAAKKQTKEFAGKAPADVISRVDSAVVAMEATVAGEDAAAIRAAMEEARQALMQIGQAAYGGATQAPPGNGPTSGAGPKGGPQVYDAEFTDSKDE
jgi:molecular chaperone DnaK